MNCKYYKQLQRAVACLWFGIFSAVFAGNGHAVGLNYERLSSIEEPLAVEVADITLSMNGLLDAALSYSDKSDNDSFFSGNFQLNAETQLSNSWTLGATYFGASDGEFDEQDYEDNAAVFLGGVWGTLAVGNVTGVIREQTRRRRGAGNAFLAFDQALGSLEDTGLTYITRLGPTQFMASVDDEGNLEIGSSYQRPLGNKDYRFSFRLQDIAVTSFGDIAMSESQSIDVVAELTYGSSVFDLAVGAETIRVMGSKAERYFASIGATRKWGVWTGSAEAHFGETEGQSETSYAAGLRYDLARGLSVNLGVNYSDAQLELGAIELINQKDTVGRVSLRYSF